jgi:hypothetical protein
VGVLLSPPPTCSLLERYHKKVPLFYHIDKSGGYGNYTFKRTTATFGRSLIGVVTATHEYKL